MFRICLLLALGALSAVAAPAHAQTTTCTAITTLPTTIGTPGVYCLKSHLVTGLTSGAAITIAADNVTLDCNGFKVGSLKSGPTTSATGIDAQNRAFVTIRGCNVRGFHTGIHVVGNYALIEDNHVNGSTVNGMHLAVFHSAVRRNRIINTGGESVPSAYGIAINQNHSSVVSDNVITGVVSNGTGESAGIVSEGAYDAFVGNRVTDLVGGTVTGLRTSSANVEVRGNHFQVPAGSIGAAVTLMEFSTGDGDNAVCSENVSIGFSAGISDCLDNGNTVL